MNVCSRASMEASSRFSLRASRPVSRPSCTPRWIRARMRASRSLMFCARSSQRSSCRSVYCTGTKAAEPKSWRVVVPAAATPDASTPGSCKCDQSIPHDMPPGFIQPASTCAALPAITAERSRVLTARLSPFVSACGTPVPAKSRGVLSDESYAPHSRRRSSVDFGSRALGHRRERRQGGTLEETGHSLRDCTRRARRSGAPALAARSADGRRAAARHAVRRRRRCRLGRRASLRPSSLRSSATSPATTSSSSREACSVPSMCRTSVGLAAYTFTCALIIAIGEAMRSARRARASAAS